MACEAGSLAGVGVLVTRPEHQAGALCDLITGHGGTVYRFPVLEIIDPADPSSLHEAVESLGTFDWAIFVSANAVEKAVTAVLARRTWPKSVRIATIGKSSAAALARFGLVADIRPERRFNSEALLELPEMGDVDGKRIAIFRGNGGREHLAAALRARGAFVQYVEAYQRVRPQAETGPLLQRWQHGEIDIVLINSAESLDNLIKMLGEAGNKLLTATPLLVVSDRMVPILERLGLRSPPVLAADATDAAVLEALLAWHEKSG